MPVPPSIRCERCGTPSRLAEPGGDCPGCLLGAALDFPSDDDGPQEPADGDCDGYVLEEVIGRGGTGVVYRARRLGEEAVALKMLAAASHAGADELRRFRLEMESVVALEHRHIVRVLGSGESKGVPYYVMGHASGGTLAARIAERGDKGDRVQVKDDARLVAKIARAVHFAHERGILHRDLKPANILIDGEGEPLVSDFGLVRLLHAPSGVTMTGAALGTPAYMAPEQAAGRDLTTAADVFSLGAILYHLLAGRPAFGSGSPLEILRRTTSEEVADPRLSSPWLDPDLATVVLTALRREPARRYSTAADFAADLERWERGEAVAARPLSRAERIAKWSRRHPAAAAFAVTGSLAGIALVTLAAAGFLIVREERNRALVEEAKARESARVAGETRDEFQQHSYAADLYQAFRAFEDGHLGQARAMLERHRPQGGSADIRGFEWHVLERLCRGDDLKCWRDHAAAVSALALSPDGRAFASGGRDGRIVLRGFPGGEKGIVLPAADAPKGAAEIPLMTAVTGRSGELRRRLMSATLNPDALRMLGRPSKLGEITALAWSPDGGHLVSASMGAYVRFWEMPDGKLGGLIPETTATDVAYSADGKWIVLFVATDMAKGLHEVKIYSADSLSLVRSIPGLQAPHAFSTAGSHIAVMPTGGTRIEIHDPAVMVPVHTWDAGMTLGRLRMSGDGSRIFGREPKSGSIGIWRVADGQWLAELQPGGDVGASFLPSPDAKQVATWGSGQTVSLHAVERTPDLVKLRGHENAVNSLVFSADGRHLLSGGNDGTTRMWSVPAGAGSPAGPVEMPVETPPGAVVTRGAHGVWTGDGKRGGSLRWERSEGPILEMPAPSETYCRLVTSSDGRFLGAVSWPRVFRILDTQTVTWNPPIRLSEGTVGPVVFSPDGEWIASGGDDHLVTVRRVIGGECIATLAAHQGTILSLSFSPDGRTLVSSAKDGTVRLWHTKTWRDLGILHRGDDVTRLEFEQEGLGLKAFTARGTGIRFSGDG